MILQAAVTALGRISVMYGGGGSTIAAGKSKSNSGTAYRHRGQTRSTTSNTDKSGGLPSVAALARFAIERERLAREMGMEELAGPATLGVVNVVAGSQGRGSDGKVGRKPGVVRRESAGDGSNRGAKGQWMAGEERAEEAQGRRIVGEILLEKLESVAEARSIQVRTASGVACHCEYDF